MPVTGHILMFISRVQRNPHEYLCATATECSAWNEILRCLRGCLPWDTNLNLHIARCIQIEALQAWTCRLLRRSSLLWFGDTSSFGFACTLIFFCCRAILRNISVFFFPFVFTFFKLFPVLCLILTEFETSPCIIFSIPPDSSIFFLHILQLRVCCPTITSRSEHHDGHSAWALWTQHHFPATLK